jgi:predicted nucleic acid-binding protein
VRGELKGVINFKVINETLKVLKVLLDKDSVSLAFSLIHSLFEIIPLARYEDKMKILWNQIKEKDLEHLATVRALDLKFWIAFDRDFEEIKEYITPKKLLQTEGFQAYETEF